MTSLYEHAGGYDALHRVEEIFYASVLVDPLLIPLFGQGNPHHVEHLAATRPSRSADRTGSPANSAGSPT